MRRDCCHDFFSVWRFIVRLVRRRKSTTPPSTGRAPITARRTDAWRTSRRVVDERVDTTAVGSILDPLVLTKSWRKAADSVGVKARLHDVRHFHISNLLRNGVPINAVQVRAGHSSPMVTLSVYGHVIPGEDELAATVFAQVMAGSEKS